MCIDCSQKTAKFLVSVSFVRVLVIFCSFEEFAIHKHFVLMVLVDCGIFEQYLTLCSIVAFQGYTLAEQYASKR